MSRVMLMGHFGLQLLCGSLLFIAITSVAAGIHLFVTLLARWQLPDYMLMACNAMAFVLFASDVVTFAVFVVVETWVLVREILQTKGGH